MPRDSNGNYSLPPVYVAVTGETITANQHNTPLVDIATALTGSLPRDGSAPMSGPLPMGNQRITNLAPAVSNTDAVTFGQARSSGLVIGMVQDFAGTVLPAGYLWCDGSAVSRADYSELFDAIGTTYGTGDGSTTFNVPDLRGRVAAGKDNMGGTAANRLVSFGSGQSVNGSVLGANGGLDRHTLAVTQIPAHSHGGNTGANGSHNHDYEKADHLATGAVQPGGANGFRTSSTAQTNAVAAHTHSIPSEGGGQAHNNVQPTLILNKIIKAQYL